MTDCDVSPKQNKTSERVKDLTNIETVLIGPLARFKGSRALLVASALKIGQSRGSRVGGRRPCHGLSRLLSRLHLLLRVLWSPEDLQPNDLLSCPPVPSAPSLFRGSLCPDGHSWSLLMVSWYPDPLARSRNPHVTCKPGHSAHEDWTNPNPIPTHKSIKSL